MSRPRAPSGLGAAGKRLWRRVLAEFDVDDPRELVLLEQAARTCDRIAALDRQVERDGVTVAGSREQLVTHPAIAEARLQRVTLVRLLDQLRVTGTEESAASVRAREAAQARWRAEVERRRA